MNDEVDIPIVGELYEIQFKSGETHKIECVEVGRVLSSSHMAQTHPSHAWFENDEVRLQMNLYDGKILILWDGRKEDPQKNFSFMED